MLFQLTLIFLLFTISRSAVLPKKVLVVGGNGRVGSQIVSRLVSQGVTTNVLVRDLAVANKNPLLVGANLFLGDVNSIDDLKKCSEGCDAVVSVHGMKPPRLTKFKELFFGASEKDLTHPYNLNYVAIKKIIAAMQMNGIKKFVRLTGSLVGKSPFSPFVFLFNFLLSGTVEWNELAEMAIREAGKSNQIDYTVIRAPEITNDKALAQTAFVSNTSLHLSPADNDEKLPARRKISYQDVAGICLHSLTEPKLSKSTVHVSWKAGTVGETDWSAVVAKTEVIVSSFRLLTV